MVISTRYNHYKFRTQKPWYTHYTTSRYHPRILDLIRTQTPLPKETKIRTGPRYTLISMINAISSNLKISGSPTPFKEPKISGTHISSHQHQEQQRHQCHPICWHQWQPLINTISSATITSTIISPFVINGNIHQQQTRNNFFNWITWNSTKTLKIPPPLTTMKKAGLTPPMKLTLLPLWGSIQAPVQIKICNLLIRPMHIQMHISSNWKGVIPLTSIGDTQKYLYIVPWWRYLQYVPL